MPDEIGERLTEIGVLISFGQKLREGLDRDERVLDLVRHAGRERAETGEAIATANLHLEALQMRDVGQDDERAEHLPARIVED